ncbi:hypothetical protein CIT292_08083 [Citrobacter youngae ATCC 29220]|uniref:Uncharacterized protein n=1 Tax=Citrobacter youngae ATCC 29220 TaxID=500640 RepID=D4BC77_9ENTR|nr:hypothetical protein CIT292_08083 [Citrobacter youngae ATCC 29220]
MSSALVLNVLSQKVRFLLLSSPSVIADAPSSFMWQILNTSQTIHYHFYLKFNIEIVLTYKINN